VVVVILVVVVIMFPAVPIIIAFTMLVPFVFVPDLAVPTFPVAVVIPATLISRRKPSCTGIRCPSPIPAMPLPVTTDGVPVTLDPNVIGTWLDWPNMFDTRCGRLANLNTKGNLSS
jgi:hypothetical protein